MGSVVGVLALQGAFRAHELILQRLDVTTRDVRTPADLDAVDALIMPGGESTTMSRLLHTSGLFDPLAQRAEIHCAQAGPVRVTIRAQPQSAARRQVDASLGASRPNLDGKQPR